MILYPNAKINLGLWILGLRNDGFHNLETAFIPVGFCDILEFIQTKKETSHITVTGTEIEAKPDENLVTRAWQLMHNEFGIPAVDIYLHKLIPVSAGLGGGSADAAFMLAGLNTYFNCGASVPELENLAGQLGSDCAFFIQNSSAIGTGRGEILDRVELSLEKYRILLVNPGISISTRDAYHNVKPSLRNESLKSLLSKPIREWQKYIINDFEESVFSMHPEIETIKNELLKSGAIYAAMSGSGSTVYGLFEQSKNLNQVAAKFSDYFTWNGPVNTIV
jgi:4-diphosphocytidyl-2-C-methyl-D-erythritol kinase